MNYRRPCLKKSHKWKDSEDPFSAGKLWTSCHEGSHEPVPFISSFSSILSITVSQPPWPSVFPSGPHLFPLCTWSSQVCSVPAHSHSRQLVSPRSPFRGPSPEHPTCSHYSYLTKCRFCVFLGCPSSSIRKSAWGFLHVRRARLLKQTPSIFLSVFTTSLRNLVDQFSNTSISFCWKYKSWDREVAQW